jgi:hypothetical protein
VLLFRRRKALGARAARSDGVPRPIDLTAPPGGVYPATTPIRGRETTIPVQKSKVNQDLASEDIRQPPVRKQPEVLS